MLCQPHVQLLSNSLCLLHFLFCDKVDTNSIGNNSSALKPFGWWRPAASEKAFGFIPVVSQPQHHALHVQRAQFWDLIQRAKSRAASQLPGRPCHLLLQYSEGQQAGSLLRMERGVGLF